MYKLLFMIVYPQSFHIFYLKNQFLLCFYSQPNLVQTIYFSYFRVNSERTKHFTFLNVSIRNFFPDSLNVLYISTSWLNLTISNRLATDIPEFVYKTSCSKISQVDINLFSTGFTKLNTDLIILHGIAIRIKKNEMKFRPKQNKTITT